MLFLSYERTLWDGRLRSRRVGVANVTIRGVAKRRLSPDVVAKLVAFILLRRVPMNIVKGDASSREVSAL